MDLKLFKDILVGFELSNNYLVYISKLKRVISLKDISIKENIKYSE
jgi:hypothetical protein